VHHAGPAVFAIVALICFTGYWWFTLWLLLAGLPGIRVVWLAPAAACHGAKDDLGSDPEDDQIGDHLPVAS